MSSPRNRRRTMSSRSQAPSTMPLAVSHSVTDVESGPGQVWDGTPAENRSSDTEDEEVIVEKTEQPGIDSLRGIFGAVGTIIRNRRRTTALSEAHNRSQARNRRGSETSGLPSHSINEGPRQPGEERDPEKLDLGHKYFGQRTTTSPSLGAPPRDTHTQSTSSILSPPSSSSLAEHPVLQASPESEKSDPMKESPKRAPVLHAHFDPNQQPPSPRLQTSLPPPTSHTSVPPPLVVDRSDVGPAGDKEKPSFA